MDKNAMMTNEQLLAELHRLREDVGRAREKQNIATAKCIDDLYKQIADFRKAVNEGIEFIGKQYATLEARVAPVEQRLRNIFRLDEIPTTDRQNPNYAASDTPGPTPNNTEWQRREEFKYPSITNGSGLDSEYAKAIQDKFIEPKDYEILAFRATEKNDQSGVIMKITASGKYKRPDCDEATTLYNMMKYGESVRSGHWEIYQVKRLIDGTVWTQGDKAKLTAGDERPIEAFNLNGGIIEADFGLPFDIPLSDILKPAPGWEIVEFGMPSCLFTQTDHPLWYKNGQNAYQHNYVTLIAREPIHAVRRKDGEVFRVGDSTGMGDIIGFRIDGQQMVVQCATGETDINMLRRLQTFTTSDSVVVKEGDTVWYRLGGDAIETAARPNLNWANHYSTREAAERGPALFVSRDGVTVHCNEFVWVMNIDGGHIRTAAPDVKNTELAYSTWGTANAAYEAWLYEQPVLSIGDIKCILSSYQLQKFENIVKEKIKNR